MTRLDIYMAGKRMQYGARFDPTGLAPQFADHFNSGVRIEVAFVGPDGSEYERKRGTVGVTSGWAPCFLLMLTKHSTGSTHTLGHRDIVTKVV